MPLLIHSIYVAQPRYLGHVGKLYRSLIGDVDFRWQEEFGGVAHIKGPMGQDILWFCDPKALQYIYQTSGYNFPKTPERRAITALTTDHGLVSVDGVDHKRQRKIMLPAFGAPESKALVPIFSKCAQSITTKWKDQLFDVPGQLKVYNIPNWLSFATMDAIGEAAFDYSFGSIENQDDEFVKAYQNMVYVHTVMPPYLRGMQMLITFNEISVETFAHLSDGKVFFMNMSRFIPLPLLEIFYAYMPGLGLDPVKRNRAIAHKFAREMVASKSEAVDLGRGRHDVMSILVGANKAESGKGKLTDYEMISQMSWGLWELARHPEIQHRLRKEVHDAEAALQARGRSQFTVSDLEAMPYAQACMKEILRLHPVVPHTFRVAGKDIAVPLSKPITTISGDVIQKVFVPKGTRVILSVAAYNRDKALWGEDAHEFNPNRWLYQNEKRDISLGVYSNLLTFSAGVRACIGWRFAVYEIQIFLIELISHFEFAWTEETKKVRREPCVIMSPVVDDITKGSQLPLQVTLVQRD
ncbi:hypothetical protein EUX98_g2562 [Antrodiella citrinella]|uniref:Cytochrome P450 n=1 Tax=Antrodiella citrinella TaxID=2447956 RepID=A0A4V3XJ41_9APHY|nr:hypothetical protein EUX98_g2562 [Antrodiella citrinella]